MDIIGREAVDFQSVPAVIVQLVENSKRLYPDTSVDIELYDAGNTWLVLNLKGQCLEVEFRPTQGFGVSILDDNTLPFTPHDWYFATVSEAETHILGLLAQFERKGKE